MIIQIVEAFLCDVWLLHQKTFAEYEYLPINDRYRSDSSDPSRPYYRTGTNRDIFRIDKKNELYSVSPVFLSAKMSPAPKNNLTSLIKHTYTTYSNHCTSTKLLQKEANRFFFT